MTYKVISAHQPNFIPYLGFFDKMKNSDVFVIRDEVLYVEKEYHNRNRIRINGNDNLNNPQSKWIGAPTIDPKDFIKHAIIKRDSRQKNRIWHDAILNDIKSNYEKSPFFYKYFPKIEKIFDNSDDSLLSLNMKIINFLKGEFNIGTEIVMASDLKLKNNNYEKSDASSDLANICRELKGEVYLSGAGGEGYLNLDPFNKENIKVEFQHYDHPVYSQCYPGFLPNMSSFDALFCCGGFPVHKSSSQQFLLNAPLSQ